MHAGRSDFVTRLVGSCGRLEGVSVWVCARRQCEISGLNNSDTLRIEDSTLVRHATFCACYITWRYGLVKGEHSKFDEKHVEGYFSLIFRELISGMIKDTHLGLDFGFNCCCEIYDAVFGRWSSSKILSDFSWFFAGGGVRFSFCMHFSQAICFSQILNPFVSHKSIGWTQGVCSDGSSCVLCPNVC